MVDAEEFDRWHGTASEALAAARVQTGAGWHNWACFLAEQAAQFATKGLLHGLGEAPWGHDLVDLGDRGARALGEMWPKQLEASFQRLSQYYIATRYPDANPSGRPSAHYGNADAETAIELAEHVIGTIADVWTDVAGAG